jgi:hypothetical protein
MCSDLRVLARHLEVCICRYYKILNIYFLVGLMVENSVNIE